jgi:hypothetical protein
VSKLRGPAKGVGNVIRAPATIGAPGRVQGAWKAHRTALDGQADHIFVFRDPQNIQEQLGKVWKGHLA